MEGPRMDPADGMRYELWTLLILLLWRFPEQRLTPLEALRGKISPSTLGLSLTCELAGMTIEPAHASFTEDVLGSLEPGKHADFVVLSQNIMEIPVTSIMDTRILATVIDGIPVYGQI